MVKINILHGPEILDSFGIGAGPAAFNIVNPEFVQKFGNFDFVVL